MKITIAHGGGGKATSELITKVFFKHFGNEILEKMEDSSVVDASGKISVTTDSFVITPLFFKGGNIGKLCVCGTVNDLLMSGAVPKYITAGFIIEEGLEFDDLEKIAESIALTAKEAGVKVVAGDTKVIEGSGGLYINTAGIGFMPPERSLGAKNCKSGDALILSGFLGDHYASILSSRMGIENNIESDCAPLNGPVGALFDNNINVRVMRDVTRGGLATVLNEIAESAGNGFEIYEEKLPVGSEVSGLCNILGLDPLYMANEGKFIAVVDENDAERAVSAMRKTEYGANAEIIGKVTDEKGVTVCTKIGGRRKLGVMWGEGLPRIC